MAKDRDSKKNKPADMQQQIVNLLTIPVIALYGLVCVLLAILLRHARRFTTLHIYPLPIYADRKVAVVTGSSQGICKEIVKKLIASTAMIDGDIYLTDVNAEVGESVAAEIRSEMTSKRNPKFVKLDIDQVSDLKALKEHLIVNYNGLDILIINAAIRTMEFEPLASFYATQNICDALFSCLRSGARVVILCDDEGTLDQVPGQKLRRQLDDCHLTRKELNKLAQKYLSDVDKKRHEDEGWPNSPFLTSKILLTALTRVLQNEVDQRGTKKDISINACFPGLTEIELSEGKELSPEEGAECPLFLATTPFISPPKGRIFWRDGSEVDWVKDSESQKG